MTDYKHTSDLRDLISTRLQQFTRVAAQDKSLTHAAVTITISSQDGNACIFLTRRSSKLRKHAGQYALPGGKLDAGETTTEAALRELSEELNLQASPEQVIGLLDDFPTQSGFCIAPVVVWMESHSQLKANPDEVAAVFQIPFTELEALSLSASEEDQDHQIKPGANANASDQVVQHNKQTIMSVYLPSVGTTVYSPTAAIIYQFREVALAGKSTRVAHFGQPKFAWR